jgi:hypothetical protein
MTAEILQFAPRSADRLAHDGAAGAEAALHDDGCGAVKPGPLRTLALTPCRSDGEFIEKLRLLLEIERELTGVEPGRADMFGATLLAADLHFNPRKSG